MAKNNSSILISIIGLIGITIGALITGFVNRSNEKEIRIFEVKEKYYSQFLETYYRYFSQDALSEAYHQKWEQHFSEVIGGRKWENENEVINCFKTIPRQCLINNDEVMKTIKAIQKIAIDETISSQAFKLDKQTISSQLMIDKNLSSMIFQEILDNKKYLDGQYEEANLGNEFYLNNFSFFDTNAEDILRNDLKSHIQ